MTVDCAAVFFFCDTYRTFLPRRVKMIPRQHERADSSLPRVCQPLPTPCCWVKPLSRSERYSFFCFFFTRSIIRSVVIILFCFCLCFCFVSFLPATNKGAARQSPQRLQTTVDASGMGLAPICCVASKRSTEDEGTLSPLKPTYMYSWPCKTAAAAHWRASVIGCSWSQTPSNFRVALRLSLRHHKRIACQRPLQSRNEFWCRSCQAVPANFLCEAAVPTRDLLECAKGLSWQAPDDATLKQ